MENLVLVKKVNPNRSLYLLDGSYSVQVNYSKDDIEYVTIEADDWEIQLIQVEGVDRFVINQLGGERVKDSWVYTYNQFADRIEQLREMWRVLDIVALELGISF